MSDATNQPKVKARYGRDEVVEYLTAVLVKGWKKKDAYIEYIDPYTNPDNVNQALYQFERTRLYQELFVIYTTAEDYKRKQIITRVQNKHALLVEKTLDKTTEIMDEASGDDKAKAVRLANETLSALAVVANPPHQEPDKGRLNKGGVVI